MKRKKKTSNKKQTSRGGTRLYRRVKASTGKTQVRSKNSNDLSMKQNKLMEK